MKSFWIGLICLASLSAQADQRICRASVYPGGAKDAITDVNVELGKRMTVQAIGPEHCIELMLTKDTSDSPRFGGMESFYFTVTDGQPVEETINGKKYMRCVFSNKTLASAHLYVKESGPIFAEIEGKSIKKKKETGLYVVDCPTALE